MKVLIAPTEDFIKIERSTLNADATAGSNITLTLINNNGLSNNDFIVIGREGSDEAELCQINASVTVGTDVRVATLVRNHKKGETITKYRYNKRKFYGALTETGSYTELTADGSPVTIQVDDPQGTMLEYTGVQGYLFFKATYYNSTDLTETAITESDAVAGDQDSRYTTLYAIRVQAGLTNNPYINDSRIERKRVQAENEINSVIFSRYVLPLSEVPPLISRLCELLAGGYLDFEEFGKDGEGVKWLGEARGILNSIKSGTQRLIGTDGNELEVKTNSSTIQSYPNTVDNKNGPVRMFTSQQKF